MLLWFTSNIAIGLYNIAQYEPSILMALSPHYMVVFFQRNGEKGWTVLGAEAMFADLGHFSKGAIQIVFSSFVYPALVITYTGEASYLNKHPDKKGTAFYSTSSIPRPVYWPMFVISTAAAIVASQSMISASLSIVKQSLALGCFPREVLKRIWSGCGVGDDHQDMLYNIRDAHDLGDKYHPHPHFFLVFHLNRRGLHRRGLHDIPTQQNSSRRVGTICHFIFLHDNNISWTYGRSKKSMYEAEGKMSLEELASMLSTASLSWPPGICLFCTNLVNGIPTIIRHYIQHTNSVREIMVILTVKTLLIKTMQPEERFIVGKLALDGVYRCLVQFGYYKDFPSTAGDDYIASVVAKLHELPISTEESEKLDSAMERGAVFVMGRTILKASKNNKWLTRFTIDYLYRFFQKNCRSALTTLEIPPGNTLQVGMVYEI
ncbi:hypothetical protein RHMOL_Rhmol09G0264800 [Rhododendron molle]|uniref:Uncharacterized protein n=1 Tax=Rhododendron molle TaxID=49168 RepID=A0ACC0MHB8_RHOML|nr:hypothetical protein RHMOL_Rhmol09G0264800 [Rhododendron molle]